MAQAKENLARISNEVEVRVHTAYNKAQRTPQMLELADVIGETAKRLHSTNDNSGDTGSIVFGS